MNIFLDVIVSFVAGLGTFLIGCKLLSDNIELLANNKIKGLFNKSSKSKLVGVGIGAATTAIVQSSSATTVLVVGLVNAGVMSLFQATTVIMGANIGTTVTAFLVSLPIAEIAMLFALIGIFMSMLSKKPVVKTLGIALAGLGLIFIGLDAMSSAMKEVAKPVDDPSTIEIEMNFIQKALGSIKNPFLLLLLGMIATAVVQSSSAMTAIIISMVGSGLVIGNGGNSVLFVILGTNIGTCITALLSSIGATTNGKRASLIHFMFNFFGSVVFTIVLLLWSGFMEDVLMKLIPDAKMQVAVFHILFNVLCTVMFLPLTKIFVKISQFIIKDKKQEEIKIINMDDRMLQYPSVALGQLTKEMSRMSYEAIDVLNLSIEDFLAKSEKNTSYVKETNDKLELMNKEIIAYLVKISSAQVTFNEEKMISSFHHNLNDIMRIGEIADNITKYTNGVVKDNLEFSDAVKLEIGKMSELIKELHKLTDMTFNSRKTDLMDQINEIEEQVDNMRSKLVNDHLDRLKQGKCQPQSSGVFINLVNNLERAADHLTYIAESV